MSIQHSTTVRNARLDAIETAIGTAPILRIRSGAVPANCGSADSGTVLCTLTLPSDWLAAASGGAKAKAGTWQDLSADAAGTAGHYRIYDSGGSTCHEQGSITATGAQAAAESSITANVALPLGGVTSDAYSTAPVFAMGTGVLDGVAAQFTGIAFVPPPRRTRWLRAGSANPRAGAGSQRRPSGNSGSRPITRGMA